MTEKELVAELRNSNWDKVYIWDAEPHEADPSHTHPFDTKLVILTGEIEIEMDSVKKILQAGDDINIPRGKVHAGLVGEKGCRYIVAEKH